MPNLEELSHEQKLKLLKGYMDQAETDPVVFIDRFLYTFNPNVTPSDLPFKLFPFQKPLVYEVKEAIDNRYDIFIEKCREMGATYVVLGVFMWFWKYIPGSNFLLGSRKEQYVDNRGLSGKDTEEMSNKEESLFGKIDYMIDRLIPPMLPKGFDMKKHFTTMSLTNPENGNVISGESSNKNFSRSGRYRSILLDEFSFWDNDKAAWGSTADTSKCRIVLTTPGIKPNTKAKRLRYGTDGEKIKLITLPYYLDPRKDAEWLEHERERRSPEDFAREIMIDWEKSIGGLVYKEFNPSLHVGYFDHTKDAHGEYIFGLDFAVRGNTAALLGYINSDGHIFILDEYREKDDTVSNHAPKIVDMIEQYVTFSKTLGFGDPAGFSNTQQGIRKNKSMTWSLADEYFDFDFPITSANNEVAAGINYVKQLFHTKKITIHSRCVKLIEELGDYRWKEQTENSKENESEPERVRKINDHLVDAMRYMLYSKPVAPQPEEVIPTMLPAQWPKINVYNEEREFDEIDFGTDLDFYRQ